MGLSVDDGVETDPFGIGLVPESEEVRFVEWPQRLLAAEAPGGDDDELVATGENKEVRVPRQEGAIQPGVSQ